MFRIALFSLFFVAASANLFPATELERRMQDFDVDTFQFQFAGTTLNAEVASELCPTEWQGMVQCVISDCPGFMDVCPQLEVPDSMGDLVSTIPPGTNGTAPDADPDMSNATDTMPEIPGCEEIEAEFCKTLGGADIEDCCLIDCVGQIKALLDCVLMETTGEDRSDCPVPACATGESTSDGDAGGSSSTTGTTASSASVVPKAAAVAAGFAFALL